MYESFSSLLLYLGLFFCFLLAASGIEQYVLVLEWVEFDLAALLELGSERLALAKSELKCLMKQLLEGLASLASGGLMHRDLKTANVLVSASGHVKISDLGSATDFTARSQFSSDICTLWYRAPELLLGAQTYDHRIDVWSAAVVFVELCLCKNFVRADSAETQFLELTKLFGVPSVSSFHNLSGVRADDMVAWAQAAQENSPAGTHPACELWETLQAKIGAEGVDLLRAMFCFDPQRRPTAAQCLSHAFFSAYPSPSRRVQLPNGMSELHSLENLAARRRKEEEQQAQQLQQLLHQRQKAQEVRKLSPDHTVGVAALIQSLTPSPIHCPIVSTLSPPAPRPRKRHAVRFCLEQNQVLAYCPTDAPCEVTQSRKRKRSPDQEAPDNDVSHLEPPSKVQKQHDMPVAVTVALPKLVLKGGRISLRLPSLSTAGFVPPVEIL